ncbi:cadherin repeat domain-containing protein [Flavobacteriaceae bacterium]|nr:cadherin repeat domain-containing protein [Flavobacteriaceae bacterium]
MKKYFKKKKLELISLFGLLLLFSCGGGGDYDVQTTAPAPVAAVITAADLAVAIPENPEANASLGTVQASVNTGSLQYSLTSQSVAGALAINASTGAVTVADATLFDFETVQSLTANIRITSGSVSEDVTVTITLTDVDEVIDPVITVSDLAVSIDENPIAGTTIGTIQASVNTGSLQFSLVSQTTDGALAVNATSGEVTVADATLFDFETVQSLTANIRITSGSVSEDIIVTITLTDVDELGAGYTIWTGATLTFTKSSGGDPTLASQQDALTDNVKITRGNTGGQIYNIVTESGYDKVSSPADTEWALGTVDDIDSLTFEPFRAATGGAPKNVVGQNLVLHLITDDVYISVKFISWAVLKAGGFAYERSTPN